MNHDDLLPEPDPADLLASARLDGDTAAPVDGLDPADVAARQRELGSVAARLAEPVTLPAAAVMDDQIARAIAAIDEAEAGNGADETEDPTGPAPVVALAPRRRSRSTSRRWLAAAAVVVVLAVAGAIAASNRPHSSSFDTVAAPVEQGASTGATPSTVAAPANQSATPDVRTDSSTTTAPDVADTAGLPDLGAVASDGSLGAEVLAETSAVASVDPTTTVPTTAVATSTTVASATPFHAVPLTTPACDASVRADVPGLGPLVFAATATYQGVPVQVMVYGTTTPSTYQLIAARATDCAVVVNRPL